MKIQTIDIQPGDLIIAYYNNKMQICRVRSILDTDLDNITFSVSPSEAFRKLNSQAVRFRRIALVELYAKGSNLSEHTRSC